MKNLIELILSIFGKSSKKPSEPSPKKPFPTGKLDTVLYKKENEEALRDEEFIHPVEFKGFSSKLENGYKELTRKNLPLKALIEDLNIFVNREFKKKLTITMIFRTQEEQDLIYEDSEKYQKKKFKSPHQFWHGVDIRSRIFTKAEIRKIVKYLNKTWNASNYYKWTCKFHTVGKGLHLHVQFLKV